MKPITVLLAEDHTIVRDGLSSLIDAEAGFQVVAQAENGRQAVQLAQKHTPDVIVMDIAMPLLNGLEATRQILKFNPKSKVLILSAHSDEAYVAKARSLGASGFLLKQIAAHSLPEAIRKVNQGLQVFSPEIAKRLHQERQRLKARGELETKAVSKELTSRETEVLQLVAEGKANKQTAAELNISIKTVEKHRQSLMGKLNIHETAGLTRYAIAEGIIKVAGGVQSTTAE